MIVMGLLLQINQEH